MSEEMKNVPEGHPADRGFPGFERFSEYFVKNYPGPDTVIFDPRWHAPKIYRAALTAYRAALAATATVGMDIPRLPLGTAVEKVGGYPFPGIVVAAFHTLSGQERFVVEATGEGYRGMLHIFNGGQLRKIITTQPD